MIKTIKIEEALELENSVFVDLRSPAEFEEATIVGSVNIPIFNDEERALLGKLYSNDSNIAIEKGLEIASHKLMDIYIKFKRLRDDYKNIIVFCWRGGMRSRSIATILHLVRFNNVFLLEGGYKNYRKYIYNKLNELDINFQLIVLHGMTGVGKTALLKILDEKGFPVINLENMAGNRGSVFGDFGIDHSVSQKMFDSLLYTKINKIDSNFVFIEAESRRIGNLFIPERLFNSMKKGVHILLKASLESRVNRILKDYVYSNQDHLENTKDIEKRIMNLNKTLGEKKCRLLVELLRKKDYISIIRLLLLNYYDPLYEYSEKKLAGYEKVIIADDLMKAVEELIDFVSNKYRFS